MSQELHNRYNFTTDRSAILSLMLRLILFLGLATAPTARAANVTAPGKSGFWIDSGNNGFLDDQLLRRIAPSAGFFVFDMPTNDVYPMSTVISNFASHNPNTLKLLYAWSSVYNPPQNGQHNRDDILAGYLNLGSLLLRDPNTGQPYTNPYLGDVLDFAYQTWISTHFAAAIPLYGADGLLSDHSQRSCFNANISQCKPQNGPFDVAYSTNMDHLYDTIRATYDADGLVNAKVFFNGLWQSMEPKVHLADQEKLLGHAQGTTVEMFGGSPYQNNDLSQSDFTADISTFFPVWARHPDKYINVFGRGIFQSYTDFNQNYLWQRYMYSCYLLGSQPNTMFRYFDDFAGPWPPFEGRAGPLDLYADQEANLGAPQGAAATQQCKNGNNGCLWTRRFANGVVLVGPQDANHITNYTWTYAISGTKYTLDGQPVSGNLTVHEADGIVLLDVPQTLYTPFSEDFEDLSKSFSPAAVLVEGSGNHYFHAASNAGNAWQYGLLLEWTKALQNGTTLQLRVRTSQVSAKLLLSAEVDDVGRSTSVVVVQISTASAGIFSGTPIDYRVPKNGGAIYLGSTAKLVADGAWHTVTISPNSLPAGNYTLKRWRLLEPVGAIDIDDVAVLTGADVAPPAVSITAPANGATVSGTIAATATASDNVAVSSVQFMLDGLALGPPLTAPPYAYSWDTTGTTNGNHTLAATAFDSSGNSATSSPVSVTVSNGSSVIAPGKVGFWALTLSNNGMYDDQMLRLVAPRAGLFIFNMATSDVYTYSTVLSNFAAHNPNAFKLLYYWISTYSPHSPPLNRDDILAGYPNLGPLLLGTPGNPPGNLAYLGDPTQAAFRTWISTTIAAYLPIDGADGSLSDSTKRSCVQLGLPQCPNLSSPFNITYSTGMDALFTTMRQTLNANGQASKKIFFNGLWQTLNAQVPLTGQEQLLAGADGATVEMFGGSPYAHNNTNQSDFATDISTFFPIWARHPDKYISVFGRGVWAYSDYKTHYLWQRYLYASYLMGSAPNTMFQYLDDFTYWAPGFGRGGSLDVYADQDIDLGAPLGPYDNLTIPGLYVRKFAKGVVVVGPQPSPQTGTTWTYPVAGVLYTPEGQPVSGNLTVKEGQGFILLNTPAPPPLFSEDFETSTKSFSPSVVQTDDGIHHYLHAASKAATAWKYDVLLDWVRALQPGTTLQLSVRTSDPNAMLLFVLDVDDAGRSTQTVVVQLSSSAAPSLGSAIAYRLPPGNQQTPYLSASPALAADGAWHTVTLSAASLPPSGYTLRRWRFMRPVGMIDIDDVKVLPNAASDATPPAVALITPSSGAVLSGLAVLTATATDNVGVASVQFQLDGASLGAAISSAPYNYSWDTTTAANGSHNLTAAATDSSGNVATSSPVMVTVSNGTQPPPLLSYNAVNDRVYHPKPALPPSGPGSPAWQVNTIYVDPTFNTRLNRVTDGNTAVGTSQAYKNHHFRVSNWQEPSWNTDGTKFFVSIYSDGLAIPFTFDKATLTASRIPDPLSPYGGLTIHDERPVFSFVDPNTMYLLATSTQGHHILQTYNYLTNQYKNLLDINSLVPPNPPIGSRINDISISAAANPAISANFGGTVYDSDPYVFYYDSQSGAFHLLNTSLSLLDGAPITMNGKTLGFAVHDSRMDRTGRYVVMTSTDRVVGRVVWDVQQGTVYSMSVSDDGHGSNGFGDYVNFNVVLPKDNGPQWLQRSLDSSGVLNPTSLQPVNKSTPAFESSYDNYPTWTNSRPGLAVPVVIDTYHYPGPDPQRALGDEILASATDGSQKVWRFAFHHSDYGSFQYIDSPVLSVSQDGRYVLFTSNWENSLGLDPNNLQRQDVFLVELDSTVAKSDMVAPAVAITSPSSGTFVSGTITVSGTASDNVGVTQVLIQVDTGVYTVTTGTASWSYTLGTQGLLDGAHVINAKALDQANNAGINSILLNVDNSAPSISNVTSSGIGLSSATVSWTTDTPADSQVDYGTTTSYGMTTALDPTLKTPHSQTLSPLASGQPYHYRVRSRDAAGNLALSGDFLFTTAAGPAGGQGPIPLSFFGMHISTGQNPWPAFSLGTVRTLSGGQSTWRSMNPSTGVYDWSYLDTWISIAQARGYDVVFTFVGTPQWASSAPNDPGCANFMGNGGCAPPNDLNPDGTGTNQHWKDFVSAIAAHAAGRIKYWEPWNEPNILSGKMWHGTTAQLVRMAQDAQAIIKAVDPSAQVATPAAASATAPSFLNDYFRLGGGAYADIIDYHAYNAKPESGNGQIANIRSTMTAWGQDAKPVWASEGSWGADLVLPDMNDETAAVARYHLLHWTNGVARFIWFGYGQGAYDPNSFGTLWDSVDGLLAPGTSYAQVNNWLLGATMSSPCALVSGSTVTWSCALTRPGGYQALAAWTLAGSTRSISAAGYLQYRDLAGRVSPITGGAATIGAAPILLENQLSADLIPPSVGISSPVGGSILSGVAAVSGTASDNIALSSVALSIDGGAYSLAVGTKTWTFLLNTLTLSNAQHTVTARATDTSGNSSTATVTYAVFNDTVAPAISINIPLAGALLNGATISSGIASDNASVAKVELAVDGGAYALASGTAAWTFVFYTTSVTDGSHALSARATDGSGNVSVATIALDVDNTPPTISNIAPTNLSSTSVTIDWTTDEPAIARVQYGTNSAYGSISPYDPTLSSSHAVALSALLPGTLYHYRVGSRDAAGNTGFSSDLIFMTAAADSLPPSISITTPANGAVVAGTVTVTAVASDNVGVSSVQFKLDGLPLAIFASSAPSFAWNTIPYSSGSHVLSAVAWDFAGNASTSASVNVTVDNAPPVISGVSATAASSVAATVSWTTSEPATTQVQYGTTTSYGSMTPFNGLLVAAHKVGLAGLQPSTLYHFRVQSKDAAGNVATSGDFQLTTASAPDTTPPTVAITFPTNGIYDGVVVIVASAADNVGVASVQFYLDGAVLGPAMTKPPYTYSWDTSNVKNNTSHTLTAVATDAAGNATTSAPVNVTIKRKLNPQADVPGLRNAIAYPNPAVRQDPVIRAYVGLVDSLEVTFFDVSGRQVASGSVSGAPTGILNGEYYYEYPWHPAASGLYLAVIHGKASDGTVVRARTRLAVVK